MKENKLNHPCDCPRGLCCFGKSSTEKCICTAPPFVPKEHSMLCKGRNFGPNGEYFYAGGYTGMKEPENCDCKPTPSTKENEEWICEGCNRWCNGKNCEYCKTHSSSNPKDWEKEFEMMMHEFYWNKVDMPFNVGEIKSFISKLLSQAIKEERSRIVEMAKEVLKYEENRKKGHLHPKWNAAKKDSIHTLENFIKEISK